MADRPQDSEPLPTAPPPGSPRAALVYGLSAAFLAVFCYVTAGLVPTLKETYWAPIAAVVVLYPQWDATRKASVDRLLGTLIGSLIGWGCASCWHGNPLIYGAGVLLAVALCALLRLENASRICAVAVTVITVIPRSEPVYLVAFHRCIEVLYGVLCTAAFTGALDTARRRFHLRW